MKSLVRQLLVVATLTLVGTTAAPTGDAEGPCDILQSSGNPCVAAHSTVRALFANYDGYLYNVTRSSDNASASIACLSPGGFADKPSHDAFCVRLDCVISNVFDQSGRGNHLGQRHKLVNASRHPITVGLGDKKTPVYGMWFDPGYGYHVDKTSGIATGNEPESIYAVMSGKNYNDQCCFDYGNSETNDQDDGCGAMEAIYFGDAHWKGNSGAGGQGPWAGADLESGMYYGGGPENTKINNQSKPLPYDFVSLSVKGREDGFTIKGGDATRGSLDTMYDGPRPDAAKASSVCVGGSRLSLQPCENATGGPVLYARQQWGFKADRKSIVNPQGQCVNIKAANTAEGSHLWAYDCTGGSNEFWKLDPKKTRHDSSLVTISSEQANTPWCIGTDGTDVILADCGNSTSVFRTVLASSSKSTTIVHEKTGFCLTSYTKPASNYQPMHKQGAIILATGGDNSNSAKGNFYEGFMATGYATEETDAKIQANIVGVGYSGFRPPDGYA